MIAYLLDTNILSYFIRGRHPGLISRVVEAIELEKAGISAIVRAEVRFGQSGMPPNDKRRRVIDLLLDQLPALPWTVAAADAYGPLKARLHSIGQPIGELDTQIAAHALAEGLVLVTHNTRHFERISGLKLEDWMV